MENPNLTSSVISIFDTSIAAYNTGCRKFGDQGYIQRTFFGTTSC